MITAATTTEHGGVAQRPSTDSAEDAISSPAGSEDVGSSPTAPACIGVERAPVDVKSLIIPCTRKPNRECCGHQLCAEHYKRHRAGVHPPPDHALRKRRRANG